FICDSVNGYSANTEYESTYETFCDFTLLADTSDPNMTNKFTVGVQNRRTDPLIYFEEEPEDKHILFLSTAELDDLCDIGGVNPLRPEGPSYSDSVWQSYYWKRFGCREITIPTMVIDSTKNIYYKIEELSDGTEFSEELPFWKKEQ